MTVKDKLKTIINTTEENTNKNKKEIDVEELFSEENVMKGAKKIQETWKKMISANSIIERDPKDGVERIKDSFLQNPDSFLKNPLNFSYNNHAVDSNKKKTADEILENNIKDQKDINSYVKDLETDLDHQIEQINKEYELDNELEDNEIEEQEEDYEL